MKETEAKVHNKEVEKGGESATKVQHPQKLLLIPTYVSLNPLKSKIQVSTKHNKAKHHGIVIPLSYSCLKRRSHDELQNHFNQPRRIGQLLSNLA